MIAMLNFHYNFGHPARAASLRSGPPTAPQYAALVCLHTAADMMVELNPGSLEGVDWEIEVAMTKIGYSGEEVLTAVPLTVARVLPTLPPAGAAACIPIVDLFPGYTREAILDPALVRRPAATVDASWPRPRANLAAGESWDDFLAELYTHGLIRVVTEDEIWTHECKQVRNGVLGVEKPTEPGKLIWIEGLACSRVRLITNLVLSNSFQFRIDGDQECLPTAGQWSALHLLPLEVLWGSERDRFCYFYYYSLPRCWAGGMTLIGSVCPRRLELEPGCPVAFGFVCPGMGWVSSFGVTKMAHRRMLFLANRLPQAVRDPLFTGLQGSLAPHTEVCPVFDPQAEVRKDRPFTADGRRTAQSVFHLHR